MKKIFIFCVAIVIIFSASLVSASITSTPSGTYDFRYESLNPKKNINEDKKEKIRSTENKKTLTASQLSCIRPFIEKRENAIIAAQDIFSTAVKSAMQTRKEALLKAWNIENSGQRNAERVNAWNAFRKSVQTARKTHQESIRGIWKTYSTDARSSCAISTEKVEPQEFDRLY